jgi:hypothetical protein
MLRTMAAERTPSCDGPSWTGSAPSNGRPNDLRRTRRIIRNQGGGELRIKNEQGRLIDSDTIKPGRESPRRDTK